MFYRFFLLFCCWNFNHKYVINTSYLVTGNWHEMCCRKSFVLMFYVKCMKMMHDWIPKKCWKESDLFCFKNLRFCWHCALYCWIFTLRGWKTLHCFQKYRAISAIKNENSFFIFMESQSVQCQSSWSQYSERNNSDLSK